MNIKIKNLLPALCLALALFSCDCDEDPGPIEESTTDFTVSDFDELEIGSALNIHVEQGSTFLVRADGDRRNIKDLDVFKSGSTLVVRFDEEDNRKHQTYITIQMPDLKKVNFSGGSVSVIEGFESDGGLDLVLSGGSVSQLDAGYRDVSLTVSGGSLLKMRGLGDRLHAEVSGGSIVNAFDFPVSAANAKLTGASLAKLTVSDELSVSVSGASSVSYKGNPTVDSDVSGGSAVIKD